MPLMALFEKQFADAKEGASDPLWISRAGCQILRHQHDNTPQP